MQLAIEHNGQELSFDVGPENPVLIKVNGKDFLLVDPFYSGEQGFALDDDNVPKVCAGWWPDGDYRTIAEMPLPKAQG